MSRKEDKKEIPVEVILGKQLASDPANLVAGMSDDRRLSKITGLEAIAYSWFLSIPLHRGGKWAANFAHNMLNLRMSDEGWRANQLVRLVAGSKGVPSIDIARKPGFIARHTSQKDWKQKAESEGKEIIE